MAPPLNTQIERPKASQLILEMQKARRRAMKSIDPGRKMKAAFALSVDARKLLVAGLRSQGFSELEIQAILSARRK
jgi:hypothetical protein